MNYSTLKYTKDEAVGRVTFNRPEIHNAFNSTVITEMAALFNELSNDNELRVIVLTGEGKSFNGTVVVVK